MRYPLRTLLLAQFGIFALLVLVTAISFAVVRRRRNRRQGTATYVPMRDRLRSLPPRQFGIFWLFALTTLAAVSFAVVRLPIPLSEKILSLLALGMCFRCWRNRNYLHPLQATISYAQRRRIAVSDFVGAVLWLPVLIWLYGWRGYRSSHALWFSDVVFWGSILTLLAIATWKLVRAIRPGQRWSNTIELEPQSLSHPTTPARQISAAREETGNVKPLRSDV